MSTAPQAKVGIFPGICLGIFARNPQSFVVPDSTPELGKRDSGYSSDLGISLLAAMRSGVRSPYAPPNVQGRLCGGGLFMSGHVAGGSNPARGEMPSGHFAKERRRRDVHRRKRSAAAVASPYAPPKVQGRLCGGGLFMSGLVVGGDRTPQGAFCGFVPNRRNEHCLHDFFDLERIWLPISLYAAKVYEKARECFETSRKRL